MSADVSVQCVIDSRRPLSHFAPSLVLLMLVLGLTQELSRLATVKLNFFTGRLFERSFHNVAKRRSFFFFL